MPARFIDVHVLQGVPYANLNRDDLGSPKSAIYGGANRIRVSSQSWKRATREHMEAALAGQDGYDRATRTRRATSLLAAALVARGWSEHEAAYGAGRALGAFTSAEGEGNVLLLLTDSQYVDIAEVLVGARDNVLSGLPAEDGEAKAKRAAKPAALERAVVAQVEEVLKSSRGIVSVFGRMLAALPQANVDAGVQVAHALTVHAGSAEFDYFTAVDDVASAAEESGAGHLGVAEFASGVFYRYATVDLTHLVDNAGDPALARALATQFLTSFVESLPSGKNNVTAPHTRPDLVVLTVREDRPQSYVSAFEAPVVSSGGFIAPAVTALIEHADLLTEAYGATPVWTSHLNAAVADEDTRARLASAFGEKVPGGLAGLVAGALDAAEVASSDAVPA